MKFFSPYCMGKQRSQFVIKKAIFMCPSFYCVIKISFSSNIMMYWILFLLWDKKGNCKMFSFYCLILRMFFEIPRSLNVNSQLREKNRNCAIKSLCSLYLSLPFIPETKGRTATCRLIIQRKFRIGRFKLRNVRIVFFNYEFISQIIPELRVNVSQIQFNYE